MAACMSPLWTWGTEWKSSHTYHAPPKEGLPGAGCTSPRMIWRMASRRAANWTQSGSGWSLPSHWWLTKMMRLPAARKARICSIVSRITWAPLARRCSYGRISVSWRRTEAATSTVGKEVSFTAVMASATKASAARAFSFSSWRVRRREARSAEPRTTTALRMPKLPTTPTHSVRDSARSMDANTFASGVLVTRHHGSSRGGMPKAVMSMRSVLTTRPRDASSRPACQVPGEHAWVPNSRCTTLTASASTEPSGSASSVQPKVASQCALSSS
mmetsp:Transcript_6201/g.18503  ORF Transcript_6201/g.18503 Transcript_6201/m.18503 type:complete len:272 (-) Transcript_6201:434-1249(-)